MQTSDLLQAIIIIIVFIILYSLSFLVIGQKFIQNNWSLFRCNPAIMPFASMFGHDAGKNFTFCIQSLQGEYMDYLLEPITYSASVLGDNLDGVTTSLDLFRHMFKFIRDAIENIIVGIFSVFINLLIEFQKIITGIKDMMGKIVGTLGTMMYVMDGTVKTMQSGWNGPPGQLVRSLGKLT
jgi:hypothetical protein